MGVDADCRRSRLLLAPRRGSILKLAREARAGFPRASSRQHYIAFQGCISRRLDAGSSLASPRLAHSPLQETACNFHDFDFAEVSYMPPQFVSLLPTFLKRNAYYSSRPPRLRATRRASLFYLLIISGVICLTKMTAHDGNTGHTHYDYRVTRLPFQDDFSRLPAAFFLRASHVLLAVRHTKTHTPLRLSVEIFYEQRDMDAAI